MRTCSVCQGTLEHCARFTKRCKLCKTPYFYNSDNLTWTKGKSPKSFECMLEKHQAATEKIRLIRQFQMEKKTGEKMVNGRIVPLWEKATVNLIYKVKIVKDGVVSWLEYQHIGINVKILRIWTEPGLDFVLEEDKIGHLEPGKGKWAGKNILRVNLYSARPNLSMTWEVL